MPTLEYNHTYTVSNSSGTVSNNVYPNWANGTAGTIYVDATAFGVVPKTILYGDPLLRSEGLPLKETPEAWLKRRVREICWVPA